MRFSPGAAMPHQLCPLQHTQVLGDCRLRHLCKAGQLVHGHLTFPRQFLKDRSTGWVGERPEHRIGVSGLHEKTIAIWLSVVKRQFKDLLSGLQKPTLLQIVMLGSGGFPYTC